MEEKQERVKVWLLYVYREGGGGQLDMIPSTQPRDL